MIDFEIKYNCNDLSEYRECWNQLINNGKYEASASFEWTEALFMTHIVNEKSLLVVMKKAGRVVGLIPLVISRNKKHGITLMNLFPISEYYNTHSDLLINDSSEELVEMFIRALFSIKYKWDILRINKFVDDKPVLKYIKNTLKKKSLKHLIEIEDPSYYIPLKETYSDYLKERSGKFRNYLKRAKKKMKSNGQVEFVEYSSLGSISNAYNQLLYIEGKSWKHDYGTSITSNKKQMEFYKKLCMSAAESRWLNLVFLYFNGEPIAYNLGLIKNRIYYYIKTSFHEEFKKLSPSTVLRAKLIEWLIRDNVKEFDFPGEPYEWESQWADSIRWHKSISIYNNTIKGRLFYLYNEYLQKRSNRTGKGKFIYNDPRQLKF